MHIEQFTYFQERFADIDLTEFFEKYPQKDNFGICFEEPKWYNYYSPKDSIHRKHRVRDIYKGFDNLRTRYRNDIDSWRYKYVRLLEGFYELKEKEVELEKAKKLLTKPLWKYAISRSSCRTYSNDKAENVHLIQSRIKYLKAYIYQLENISDEQPKLPENLEYYWHNYLLTVEMVEQEEKFKKPVKKRKPKIARNDTKRLPGKSFNNCIEFYTCDLKDLIVGYDTITILGTTINGKDLRDFLRLYKDDIFTVKVIVRDVNYLMKKKDKLYRELQEGLTTLNMTNDYNCTVNWCNKPESKNHLNVTI